MSSTNKTTNLELSQFIGSDSPKWLTDYNADMEKIDAGYQTVKAQADATDLIVGGHTSSISTLQDTTTSQGTAITGLRTEVNGNTGSINTINSLIGNGEPTTTDKTIIGAINELDAETVSTKIIAFATVEADGVKTYGQLFAELSTLIVTNLNTLRDNEQCNIVAMAAENYYLVAYPSQLTKNSSSAHLYFYANAVKTDGIDIVGIYLHENTTYGKYGVYDTINSTFVNKFNDVPTSGHKFSVFRLMTE